jgi:chromate transporter
MEKSALEVFVAFLRLGLTCFGGPIAHLGYFRAESIERRRWLGEKAYAELVSLAQFLPGPASSQVGFGIGLSRAGWRGGLAAWLGFTTPSAVLMLLFAWGAGDLATQPIGVHLLHGLKLVAVAIVAQAVFGMARSLCPDRSRATIALVGLIIVLFAPGAVGQISAIALGALVGAVVCRADGGAEGEADVGSLEVGVSRRAALVCLVVFVALLAVAFLPAPTPALFLFDAFYKSGALVFGGGHVVLPLLRSAVVAPGMVSDNAFLAGYGAAQAMPGPLFTFAAYLGAVAKGPTHGLVGAVLALAAIFLPGLLALVATLPFWSRLRRRTGARAAMRGVNAAVVGLLAAALYDPVWTGAVFDARDFAIAAAGFVALAVWRAPPLVVVIFTALAASIGA